MRGLHYLPRRLRKRYSLTKAEIEFLTTATISNYIAKTGHVRTPRVGSTRDYIAWDDLPTKSTKGTP